MIATNRSRVATDWLKEHHIELALSAGKVGIFEWNLVSGKIAWSPQNYLIFGVDPGTEITYDLFLSRVRPQDVDALEQRMEAAKTSRTEFEHEYGIVLPDGQSRSVVGKGKFVYGLEGNATSMAGVVIDTTETNELRSKLAASEREFASVIDNSPVILARFSTDLRHLYVSSAIEAYIGVPAVNCLGKTLEELNLPAEVSERWARSLRQAIASKQSESLRLSIRTQSGEHRYLESRLVPDLTPIGEVGSVLAITADVTREELAQQEAKLSELRFRALADAMPLLVWSAHADGFIHWYNQSWYDYTGTTEEDMAGWGWQSVHDPEMLPAVLGQWQASIASGEPFEMVFPLRGADGTFRLFLTRARPVKDSAGRVRQWAGTNTDVSALDLTNSPPPAA